MVHILGDQNSVFNQFLAEIRDEKLQKEPVRFRRNLERLGEIFAYEISKELEYEEKEITTPLGTTKMQLLKNYPVLGTILRAGLPMHQGLLNFFDQSQNAFISAYRKVEKGENFTIQIEYVSSPDLAEKVLVLSDPMLATGQSMVLTCKELFTQSEPSHIHIVSAIASDEGVEYVRKHLHSKNVDLWVGAVDGELTAQAYIVPGLGDAGDLAYGIKD
ncbi:MAG: uracil phosphoribosyltransferase [Bacteroidales bacterium]|nr:uracil phosphoribosyltransferase [Bacteroidales bacterium]